MARHLPPHYPCPRPRGQCSLTLHLTHCQVSPILPPQPPGAAPLLRKEQLSRNPKLHKTRLEVWSQPRGRTDWEGMNTWQQTRGM